MPKVSIIVPVYNTEKYIGQCLNSLVNQTFKDIEIIIINDGSTDNSDNIIKKYLNKYPNLIKYYIQNNKGVSAARNFGVRISTGNYIAFVDSDDFLDTTLLYSLLHYMEQQVDLIKYKTNVLDNNLNLIEQINGPVFNALTGEDAFNKLFVEDVLMDSACLYLFNSNFLKKNKFEFLENTYHEDFGLVPLIIATSNSCVSTNIYGYNYLTVENSIMRNDDYKKTLKKAFDLFLHYDNMLNRLSDSSISESTRKNIIAYYSNAIFRKINTLNKEDKKLYKEEIKKRYLVRNVQIHNLKQLIKKFILLIKFS